MKYTHCTRQLESSPTLEHFQEGKNSITRSNSIPFYIKRSVGTIYSTIFKPLLHINCYSKGSAPAPLPQEPSVVSFVLPISFCRHVLEPLLHLTDFIYCLFPSKTVNHLGKNQVLNTVPHRRVSTQWHLVHS